ncbi:hypothetical protein EG68_01210 [Paragonimus skrjabini miyazakii]|uniref:Integrase catalytic domain-containing protein n=1 Tax=Paragonimus skrjabini miyazakii TaxID=59628 RepID=A0A8S9Z471_9TREM|nr:hypothetical protein EG68_01210 [Paragonimus skrjabini miyazakii]
MDILHCFSLSNGHTLILSCADRFARRFIVFPLDNALAETSAYSFSSSWISISGIPTTISVDRGSQFNLALSAITRP